MKIVYTGENPPKSYRKSIFLAGPTPRSPDVKSWRLGALRILESNRYDGVVFVPEFRESKAPKGWTYKKQCDWEHKCLDMADIILFWVSRKLRTMPAFTTNIEFEFYANSGRLVIGAPKRTHKMKYFQFMAGKFKIPYFRTLEDTAARTMEILGNGAFRKDGERSVPLLLWNSVSFQNWYKAQKDAGNKLKGASMMHIFHKVGPNKDIPWGWVMRPNLYVAKERRHKYNDPIVARPDISAVILIKREHDLLNSKIILVREFRSAVSNQDGFVLETPSGSSHDPYKDPVTVALDELEEETGFSLDKKRLKPIGSRQLASTFSIHKAHAYFAEISEAELKWFQKRAGKLRVNDKFETGERLYIEIKTVEEILEDNLVDWSNIGMILSALSQ